MRTDTLLFLMLTAVTAMETTAATTADISAERSTAVLGSNSRLLVGIATSYATNCRIVGRHAQTVKAPRPKLKFGEPAAATIGRDALCASEGRAGGHPSGGLAVARSERARMPASDERTATVAPLLSPPPSQTTIGTLTGG